METERFIMNLYIEKLLAGERVSIEALFCAPTPLEETPPLNPSTPDASTAPEQVWH